MIKIEMVLSCLAGIITSLGVIFSLGKKLQAILFKDIFSELKELKLNCKRNELLILYNNQPEKVEVIEKAYDEYVELKGNSYIHDLHAEWKRKYAKKIIDERI